jgi:hypothetical protein
MKEYIIEIVNRDFRSKRFLISLRYETYPEKSYCVSTTYDQLIGFIYDYLQANPEDSIVFKNCKERIHFIEQLK